jgi:mannose-1-phosphate guanylyltransferase
LLLAAGLGTRLRPLTDTVPKCLVPVNGRPLLDYWLALLLEGGIERVLINTHWLHHAVEHHVAHSRWRERVDLVHEPALLGTGGTLLANAGYFGGEAFLVAHADNLARFDVHAFVAAWTTRRTGIDMVMMTFETDTPRSCGIVATDPHGTVREFHEKVADPPGRIANAAVYIVGPAVMSALRAVGGPVIDLSTEVIPRLIGRIRAHPNDGYLRDIGTPESLRRAERDFAPSLHQERC